MSTYILNAVVVALVFGGYGVLVYCVCLVWAAEGDLQRQEEYDWQHASKRWKAKLSRQSSQSSQSARPAKMKKADLAKPVSEPSLLYASYQLPLSSNEPPERAR